MHRYFLWGLHYCYLYYFSVQEMKVDDEVGGIFGYYFHSSLTELMNYYNLAAAAAEPLNFHKIHYPRKIVAAAAAAYYYAACYNFQSLQEKILDRIVVNYSLLIDLKDNFDMSRRCCFHIDFEAAASDLGYYYAYRH
jgi:hypothetical protein